VQALALAREQNARHFAVEALLGLATLGVPESTPAWAGLRDSLASLAGETSPVLEHARVLAST
jgi:hypothetical protein